MIAVVTVYPPASTDIAGRLLSQVGSQVSAAGAPHCPNQHRPGIITAGGFRLQKRASSPKVSVSDFAVTMIEQQ
jgi:hypothetical protein